MDIKPPTDSTKILPKVEKSERNKCQICNGPERCNQQQKPEIFVSCSNCKGNGKIYFMDFNVKFNIQHKKKQIVKDGKGHQKDSFLTKRHITSTKLSCPYFYCIYLVF